MKATLTVRGMACTWSIDTDLSREELRAMQADGLDIGKLVYSEKWTPPAGHPLSQHSPIDREGN